MTATYERSATMMAAALNNGTPPRAENWLARRVHSLQSHEQNVGTIAGVFSKLGATMLNGKIATDVRTSQSADVMGTKPSQPVAETSFAILPTQRIKRWGSHGLWTPDTATIIGITLSDRYADHHDKLHPAGEVDLTLHAQTWGTLPPGDTAALPDARVSYGTLGWSKVGTSISVTRQPGETFEAGEVEAVLAPFARNVADYYDIMDEQPNRLSDEPGNFSGGPNHPYSTERQAAHATYLATIGLPPLVES